MTPCTCTTWSARRSASHDACHALVERKKWLQGSSSSSCAHASIKQSTHHGQFSTPHASCWPSMQYGFMVLNPTSESALAVSCSHQTHAQQVLPSKTCDVQPVRCCHVMQTTLRIRGHDDDVNAVAFLDNSSNLIASGSDDTLIKVSALMSPACCQDNFLVSSQSGSWAAHLHSTLPLVRS